MRHTGTSVCITYYRRDNPVERVLVNRCIIRLGTAWVILLYRWAFHSGVGTEYTTVTRFWPQQRFAVFALVKPLAGICRHYLRFLVATVGTGNL